jgi:hypothetical protein
MQILCDGVACIVGRGFAHGSEVKTSRMQNLVNDLHASPGLIDVADLRTIVDCAKPITVPRSPINNRNSVGDDTFALNVSSRVNVLGKKR